MVRSGHILIIGHFELKPLLLLIVFPINLIEYEKENETASTKMNMM